MILLRLSDFGRTMEGMTMTIEGLADAQHGPRVFREGCAVQVTELGSARLGQRGEVVKIWSGGAYNVIVRHPDGVELPYRPEELAAVL